MSLYRDEVTQALSSILFLRIVIIIASFTYSFAINFIFCSDVLP